MDWQIEHPRFASSNLLCTSLLNVRDSGNNFIFYFSQITTIVYFEIMNNLLLFSVRKYLPPKRTGWTLTMLWSGASFHFATVSKLHDTWRVCLFAETHQTSCRSTVVMPWTRTVLSIVQQKLVSKCLHENINISAGSPNYRLYNTSNYFKFYSNSISTYIRPCMFLSRQSMLWSRSECPNEYNS